MLQAGLGGKSNRRNVRVGSRMTSNRLGPPAINSGYQNSMDFAEDGGQVIAVAPPPIMGSEFAHITDPPNVIAPAVVLDVGPLHFLAANLFAEPNGFEYRAVGVSAAAHVVNLAATRFLKKMPESID